MSDWQSAFGEIDDDYLIGISNKGIVKRAYKDMETTPCMIAGQCISGDCKNAPQDILAGVLGQAFSKAEIAVQVGGETVQVRLPPAESTCSCPSRSICRHVVQGILALKAAAAKYTDTGEKAPDETAPDSVPVAEKTSSESEKSDNSAMIQKVTQQIKDYPLERLCKALGTRRIQEIVSCARAGRTPQITYSSVATVQPVAKAMTVRLLYPLEHATCTCHKKEFCVHKAEAVLWCKLDLGQLCVGDLEQAEHAGTGFDLEQVQEAARQMRAFLEELLDTGLSRTPHDVLDHMERLATVSHNAKLPNFESSWRRLQDSYQKYMQRVASLRIQALMRQLTGLYRQVTLLESAQSAQEVSRLAGVFRAQYTSAPDLDLVGIAAEHFVSKGGYEGDTVYFLEQKTKKWYTYTQARPVFYDNSASGANRAGQYSLQEPPWGLTVSFTEFSSCRIHLENARCDSRGRLSASRETKGQLTGQRSGKNALTTKDLGKWYYRDFARLFRELFEAEGRADSVGAAPATDGSPEDFEADGASAERLTDFGQMRLVVLKPAFCDRAVFLETEQKLSMNLYDESGKAVVVEVVYSRNEADGIQYLENITNDDLPSFFGKVYLRGGRIRMYPITVFGRRELLGTESF